MLDITYSRQAKNYLKKLNDRNLKDEFKTAILEIREDPSVGIQKRGDLAGIYGYDLYYTGINYEIAYTIEKEAERDYINLIMVGTRENFWKEIKRYID